MRTLLAIVAIAVAAPFATEWMAENGAREPIPTSPYAGVWVPETPKEGQSAANAFKFNFLQTDEEMEVIVNR